jgi:hypothetical protein
VDLIREKSWGNTYNLPCLGEPFYKLMEQGRGLGLIICHKVHISNLPIRRYPNEIALFARDSRWMKLIQSYSFVEYRGLNVDKWGTADKTRILYANTLFGNRNPDFSTLSRIIRVSI